MEHILIFFPNAGVREMLIKLIDEPGQLSLLQIYFNVFSLAFSSGNFLCE